MSPERPASPKWGPGHWPDEEECIALLKKAGCSDKLIEHLRLTERIAMVIADRIIARCRDPAVAQRTFAACSATVDAGLVRAGAMLHDIGRGRTHGIMHAVEGAKIGHDLGLPEEILRIIERHIGAGIAQKEATRLGLPPQDYIPITVEEKIVAHADNLSGKHGKLKFQQIVDELERKGVPEIIPRMKALHRDLGELAGSDLDDMNI